MLLAVRAVPGADEDGQRDDGAPCLACKVTDSAPYYSTLRDWHCSVTLRSSSNFERTLTSNCSKDITIGLNAVLQATRMKEATFARDQTYISWASS